MVLKGESLKASCYVTHGSSLGILREKMVSRLLVQETPDRFRVETGLIRNHTHEKTSRQCDLLVYEPQLEATLYRWEDFVVVHDTSARAVVEVKSNLEKSDFDDLLNIHRSLIDLEFQKPGQVFIPTFGYALQGVTFDTFVSYLRQAIIENPLGLDNDKKLLNLPVCIAVQSRNYLAVRPFARPTGSIDCVCAINLAMAIESDKHPADGIETGFFLQIYSEVLRLRIGALNAGILYEWFNNLPLKPEGKMWITVDGEVHQGNVTT